jgi:hypothetical protein
VWGVGKETSFISGGEKFFIGTEMVDVGFLQELYFPTKISKSYLLTAKT